MQRVVIETWEQLRERVQLILERINADPSLATAAAANPMLALEDIGFDIIPSAREAIEERFRFHPRVAVRVRQLKEEIYRHAGRHFDLSSAEELGAVLFDRLGITPGDEPPSAQVPPALKRRAKAGDKRPRDVAQEAKHDRPRLVIDVRPLTQLPGAPPPADPLETLAGAHAIVEPLLEYRRLDASRPRLAPRDLYDEIRRGDRRLPVTRLVARLKAQR